MKTLETTLAERNATIRILQSKSSSGSVNMNNIEELIAATSKLGGVAMAPPPTVAGGPTSLSAAPTPIENILSIPVANSSPHKKQFSTPSILATPPQYHSLNLSKKLGSVQAHAHAHRSLTPSADMFLRSGSGVTPSQHEQLLRSVTPSGGGGSATLVTPSSAEILRANEILRATPTSVELHRLSAPADILRATPTSAEFLRATPTSALEYVRATPTSAERTEQILRSNPELLKALPTSVADMLSRATPTTIDHHAHSILRAPPSIAAVGPSSVPDHMPKRSEPSGTSEVLLHHPGPT